MYKALFFDLDKTLCHIDSDFIRQNLTAGLVQMHVPEMHQESILAKLSIQFLSRHVATSRDGFLDVFEDMALPIPENLDTVIQKRNQAYFEACSLMEGVKELLKFLNNRNIPLAIITNGPADMQLGVIRHLKLEPYFQTILVSGEVGFRKPDKRVFDLALTNLACHANEALMIGDNPLTDIQGALDAGLSAIQIGTREPKLNEVKRVESILELHSYLDSIIN